VQHRASRKKENPLDKGNLQARAKPCNALVITRNEQESGSSLLVGSHVSLHLHQNPIAKEPRYRTFAAESELNHDDLASIRNCKNM
jgi:hypothetical protein